MNSPVKLTDTQFTILSEASQHKDRCLIAPSTLKGGAAQKLAAKLLTGDLAIAIVHCHRPLRRLRTAAISPAATSTDAIRKARAAFGCRPGRNGSFKETPL